jgi:hypothetical protein
MPFSCCTLQTVKKADLIEDDTYYYYCQPTHDHPKSDGRDGYNNGVFDDDDEFDESEGQLKLANNSRVPNCCAICLMSYEVDDTVVWSSNDKCAHAFHEECVVGWLIKQQPDTPCPCCRQEFITNLEEIRMESKIKWDSQNAFNMNALSL